LQIGYGEDFMTCEPGNVYGLIFTEEKETSSNSSSNSSSARRRRQLLQGEPGGGLTPNGEARGQKNTIYYVFKNMKTYL
jgi:hypothetical protein